MKIEKYICNSCGVEVICRDWDKVIEREKMCIECSGLVEMSDETLKRIALKNSNAITTIKANSTRNKLKNLEWVAQPQNLRREPTKKKKSKKKEPLWKRYRDC